MPDLGANPLHSPSRCTCHLRFKQQHPGTHITECMLPVELSGTGEVVIPRSLRSNDDIQHDTQISTQTLLSTELSTTKPNRKTTTKRQIRGSWLHQKLRAVHYNPFQIFRYPLTDDRMCYTIDIEVLVGDGHFLYSAIAVVDTGCPRNLMCRTLASELGNKFLASRGDDILHTLGTDNFRSLGKRIHRWRFQAGQKFYEGVWEISDKEEEFEVIIGRDTMIHNKLLKLSPDLR
jgi:hypothetical protein